MSIFGAQTQAWATGLRTTLRHFPTTALGYERNPSIVGAEAVADTGFGQNPTGAGWIVLEFTA